MFCQKCGKELIDENAEFCGNCGSKILREKPSHKIKISPKVLIISLCVIALFIIVILGVKLIGNSGKIDITHGGEKVWIASSEGEEYLFDYNWAQYDEEWEEVDDIIDEIDKDYIEERLKPVHYNKDTYFDFCPSKAVKHAENSWKRYLKAHKELKKMYISVNGDEYFPYADDDFDKKCFINEGTVWDFYYDPYNGTYFENEFEAKQFFIKIFKSESMYDIASWAETYGFYTMADYIYECIDERGSGSGSTSYYYPEESLDADEQSDDVQQMSFLLNYFPECVYKGDDGSIYASFNDEYGAYALTVNIK